MVRDVGSDETSPSHPPSGVSLEFTSVGREDCQLRKVHRSPMSRSIAKSVFGARSASQLNGVGNPSGFHVSA